MDPRAIKFAVDFVKNKYGIQVPERIVKICAKQADLIYHRIETEENISMEKISEVLDSKILKHAARLAYAESNISNISNIA